jgi:hypothetical protein
VDWREYGGKVAADAGRGSKTQDGPAAGPAQRVGELGIARLLGFDDARAALGRDEAQGEEKEAAEGLTMFLLSDSVLFPILELLLLFLCVLSTYHDRSASHKGEGTSVTMEVTRAEESRQKLSDIFQRAVVAILFVIPLYALANHKVLFSLLNLAAGFYLCFWSSWSRNRLLGLARKVETRPEKH